MRILELTHRFPPAIGGVETHVHRLALGLAGAGVDVEVLTTDLARDRPFARLVPAPETDPFPVRRYRAVEWIPVPHGLWIVSPGMMLDALARPADVVHAHAFGYFPTWVGAFRRRLKSTPFVLTPHSEPGAGTRGGAAYGRIVARLTARRADRVIALTELERAHLAGLGVDPARIRVIPNGIDLAEFTRSDPIPPAAGEWPPVILFVGRLYPRQKGLEPLIRAFAGLPRDLAPELRIVGEDWGGLDLVRSMAGSLGVADRVVATGAVDRAALMREYRNADVFVLPSLFEPFGIVLLEAMASGVPIVASRVGGVPEILEDDRTAVLVPPGDVTALSEALDRLLRDSALRARLAAAGRTRVEDFSWDRLLPKFLRLFSEATSQG